MRNLLSAAFTNIWQKVSAPVPVENAVCEFECRELDCSEERWKNCERRKNYVNLMKSVEWHNPEDSCLR